jgi:hypothetical protein
VGHTWSTTFPFQVWAEETLTVVLAATPIAQFDRALSTGAQLVRARLEGGPIRYRFLLAPTTTDGTPLFNGDSVEWTGNEIYLLGYVGGFIVGSAAAADAKLYVTYYR